MSENKSILSYLYNHNYNEIDPSNFVLPTTKDFHSTELPYKLEQQLEAGKDNDFTRMLYFIEKPYSECPGYYDEDRVIIVKGKPNLRGEDIGKFDADTMYFPVSDLNDNNAKISYNGNLFTVKEYLQYSSANFGDASEIGVRFIGINAPETFKYKIVLATDSGIPQKIKIAEIAKDSKHQYLYDTESDDYKNDTMKFFYKNIDGMYYYCQATEYPDYSVPHTDTDGSIYYTTELAYKYIYKSADANGSKISHEMAQKMIELIGDNECVLMLDHNMLNSKSGSYPTTYDQYDDSLLGTIKSTIESLSSVNSGPKYSGFSGFGQDGYGRFLGCLYVKTLIPGLPESIQNSIGEQWINVTKYLLYFYGPDGTVNHDLSLSFNEYSPTHVANYNFASSAFKVWTYDNSKKRIEDMLDNASFDSITRQREIQKQVLGFDFNTQLKDWTVMIGDYVFLIPPTSIRCMTRNSSEAVPLIRSRGSAIKETPQSERMLEMTLYFNDESGINGIEIEVPATEDGEDRRMDENTLAPTDEKLKYYMNGLRALISMFKFCPFLPITNEYINNTLNIEAVALSSLYISTVPNFPKCIAATIQLVEFNYHAYMSEIPLTGDESAETIMYSNLFEKCIDFDALRYYYQKPLYRGELASRYSFDSPEYLNLTYGGRTALQPMTFDDSSIEFYMPDSNHLNTLLQVKMESMSRPIKSQYKVTDDVKAWAAELGKLYPILQNAKSTKQYIDLYNFINYGPTDKNKNPIFDSVAVTRDNDFLFTLEDINKHEPSVKYEDLAKTWDQLTYSSYYSDIFNEGLNPDNPYQFSINNSYIKKYYIDSGLRWKTGDGSLYFIYINYIDIIRDIFVMYNNDIINTYTYTGESINITTRQGLQTNKNNIINFLKNISIDLDKNYSNYFNDNGEFKIDLFTSVDSDNHFAFDFENADSYKLIEYCFNYYTIGSEDKTQFELPSDVMQTTVNNIKEDIDLDTENSFKFIKYPNESMLQSLIVTNISASFNNNLTRTYLKAMDGYAPQYLGGQDTVIELSMQTQDDAAVAAINLLPKLCSEYMRNYRLILSCCPLRINTAFTKMLGVNEVLIESVNVSTVENQPGVYQIDMRLIAMDRTVRNKEALKRLDINNAGAETINSRQSYTTRDYFGLKEKISAAEIYPDLELPTIAELDIYGFTYIKYKIYDTYRIYPDPDFYFVYGAATTNKTIRDSVLDSLEENSNNRPTTFTMADYLGGELSVDLTQDGSAEQFNVNSRNQTATAEENLVSENQDAINNYKNEIYNLKIKNGSVFETIYNGQSLNTFLDASHGFSSVDDVYSFINIISNLKNDNYWNFSSKQKCIFRGNLKTSNSEYLGFFNYIYKCNDIITFLTQNNPDYNYNTSDYFSKICNKTDFNSIDETIDKINNANKSTLSATNSTCRSRIDGVLRECFLDGNFPDNSSSISEPTIFFKPNTYNTYGSTKNYVSNNSVDDVVKSIKSIADAFTGLNQYVDIDDKTKPDAWQFNMFCGSDDNKKPIYLSKNNSCNTLSDIINSSYSFGPFHIRQYPGNYIKQHFYLDNVNNTESQYARLIMSLQDDKYYFLNPIIMDAQINYYSDPSNVEAKKIIDGYKLGLLFDTTTNAIEIILNLAIYYQSLIYNNILISEIQLICDELASTDQADTMSSIVDENLTTIYASKDYLSFSYEKTNECTEEISIKKDNVEKLFQLQSEYEAAIVGKSDDEIKQIQKSLEADVTSYLDSAKQVITQFLNTLQDIYSQIHAGNLLAVESLYINGLDNNIYKYVENRDYDKLNDLFVSSQMPIASSDNIFLYKYFLSLAGREVIKSIEDLGSSDYAPSEIASGIIDEVFYLNQVNDPYTYTRDSFYDMITNDMRGRMARAFPAFYMLFVDEGREIGLWKLNDNFYNMSSISEITITKSRKIAADTCTIQMTNMFKTFTTDDEDGKEMAYDLETLSSIDNSFQDLWDSIWSPRKLFLREYQERIEQNPIERAQLKPGVRVHVRMGYGGDAYSLPTVFNGVVAQVSTGELVTILCQGDGVELSNPVNDGMKYSDDIESYDDFPIIAKQIDEFVSSGATPKTILTKFLTTKGTWGRKLINTISSGRFFNDNPFGITHFGDPDYTDIFNLSECAQNIYEAYKSPMFNSGVESSLTQMQYMYNTDDIPKVSTQISGKSYWDLMHVMAGVAPDYIASVAPFGMRSTIFYGLPHYYYAYEYYKSKDNTIKEKRKPFQQYHIYSSYSDIIENNITTSSEFMKTNAVGLYSVSGALGNLTAKRVGPVFADIDIYSEYQKSMTVDTTYVSNYSGLGGIIGSLIPFVNSIRNDAGTITGTDNESIAWRITVAALKDAVKEMYQGELITIGDPSIKPYDAIYLHDVYENMQGGCEVEAVTHILNSQTGFTSSIYVDPMVDVDNRYYQTAHMLSNFVCGQSIGVWTAGLVLSFCLSRSTQPVTKLAGKLLTRGVDGMSTQVTNILNLLDLSDDTTEKIANFIKGTNILGTLNATYQYEKIIDAAKILKGIDLSGLAKLDNATKLTQYLKCIDQLSQLNLDDLYTMVSNKKTSDIYYKIYQGLADGLSNMESTKNSTITNAIIGLSEKFRQSDGLKELAKTDANVAEYLTLLDNIGSADFTKPGVTQKYISAINQLKTFKEADDIGDFFAGSSAITDLGKAFDSIGDGAEALGKVASNSDDITKALNKTSFLVTKGSVAATIVGLVVEYLVEAIITGTVTNAITRYLRNLEVLRIYPLIKNKKVYTAGLSGSRGLVVGSSTFNKQGWFQNFISDFFNNSIFRVVSSLILPNTDNWYQYIDSWKRDNNMALSDSDVNYSKSVVLSHLSKVSDGMSNYDGILANRITLERIKTFSNDSGSRSEIADALQAFSNYYVSDKEFEYNGRLNEMKTLKDLASYLKQSNVPDGVFSYYHSIPENDPEEVSVHYNDSILTLESYHSLPNYPDLNDYAILSCDCICILHNLIQYYLPNQYPNYITDDNKQINISVVNALVPGYSNSWLSTGYQFTFYTENIDHDTLIMLLDQEKKACNNIFEYDYTEMADDNILYRITVYPPNTNSITNGDNE